jgi:hypothetical protein
MSVSWPEYDTWATEASIAATAAAAGTPNAAPAAAPTEADGSAQALLYQTLDYWGLGDLAEWAWDLRTGKATGAPATNGEVYLAILQHPLFQEKYPAFEQLSKDGRGISVDDYQSYQKDVREYLQAFGVPSGMYDTPADIAKLLLNDVSREEVRDRLNLAAQASFTAPVEVRNALVQRYNATPGDLVGYYLDPDKAAPLLEQQYRSAQVIGAAERQGFNVATAAAERIASQGVEYGAASQGFAQARANEDLTRDLIGGSGVSEADLIEGTFGDAEAARRTERVARRRSADYRSAVGGAISDRTGVSGLGSSST